MYKYPKPSFYFTRLNKGVLVRETLPTVVLYQIKISSTDVSFLHTDTSWISAWIMKCLGEPKVCQRLGNSGWKTGYVIASLGAACPGDESAVTCSPVGGSGCLAGCAWMMQDMCGWTAGGWQSEWDKTRRLWTKVV